MTVMLIAILTVLGAGLGSFACCQVWRIRKNDKSKWSHCLSCGYRLRWYDNIPILSWLMMGGKCRKCHKKIGAMEILAEVGMAAVFRLSVWLWPELKEVLNGDILAIMRLVIYFILITALCICFLYDAKWKELPVVVLAVCTVLAFLYYGVNMYDLISSGEFEIMEFLSGLLGLVLLPGFYFLLYRLSKEKWVGGGDYLLCIPLAMVLNNAWLAMSCLFVSNLLGCAVMLPVIYLSKKKDKMIPMGPFLILGFLVVFFCKELILEFVSI
jgi:prepilin signal peptidase PulO-like enzyme (type II secretory pathway)